MSRVPRLVVVLAAGLVLTACSSSHRAAPGAAGSPSAPASAAPSPPPASPPAGSPPASAPASLPPGPGEAPPGGADSGTGISGLTVAVGHCPVMRDESSCPDIPIAAAFTVLDAGTHKIVTTVRSGADGHFRIAVRPGRYVLEAPMKLPRAVPTPVTVDAGQYTNVTMRFDTGVR
jgi:hypothetical protein